MLYIPIHVHTTFSVLDGLAKIDELVAKAKEFNIPALAITDHRNVYGHVKFYGACKDAGIKPLLGVELNEADDRTIHSRKERQEKGYDDYHIVMIAKDYEGYRNLMKIVSDASTVGYFDKTEQTDMSVLSQYGRGIIATSACLAGRIPRYVLSNRIDEAKQWICRFKEVFDRFYLEVQPNNLPEQQVVNEALLKLSKETGTPLILGTDIHYITPEDAAVQDVLLCIQTGKTLKDENRLRFHGDPLYYFWSPQEVEAWLKRTGMPYDLVENTLLVADECNVELPLGFAKMPTFKTPDGTLPEEYLKRLCYEELERRFGSSPDYPIYRDRLEYELSVIIPKGFASYFLILQDILSYCDRQGIPRGGGRGSAAGSLVAYLLRITNIDPITNGLLFERFLNPERVSLPDIDCDISHEHRDEVIAYVREAYGHVAQIATYSLLHPKGAVRDICRVLGIPYSVANILSDLVPDKMPDQSEVTLDKFFLPLKDKDKAVAKWGQEDAESIAKKAQKFLDVVQDYPDVLPILERLEGVVRSVGIHAGGVLIAPTDLTDYCSLIASPGKAVCSLDMEDVDVYGLLKIDLLGLKTVSVISKTAKRVGIDIDNIPLDDPEVYKLYQEGRTHGIFQMSGDGITRYTKEVRPTKFSDLVDILALYRPGPMTALTESGRTMIEQYVYNREHRNEIVYPHPDLKDILEPTYGVLVYQEQVMNIAKKLAGYTMGQADVLRKLIAKKKIDELPAARAQFVQGGVSNGYSEELMQRLFDQIEAFGGLDMAVAKL